MYVQLIPLSGTLGLGYMTLANDVFLDVKVKIQVRMVLCKHAELSWVTCKGGVIAFLDLIKDKQECRGNLFGLQQRVVNKYMTTQVRGICD